MATIDAFTVRSCNIRLITAHIPTVYVVVGQRYIKLQSSTVTGECRMLTSDIGLLKVCLPDSPKLGSGFRVRVRVSANRD